LVWNDIKRIQKIGNRKKITIRQQQAAEPAFDK